jgi:hypothetical protein
MPHKLDDIFGVNANAVKAISDVNLDELHRTVSRVSKNNLTKQPTRQSIAKLHGVPRSNKDRLLVLYELVGVINVGMWALWDWGG